jgi:hypothetical protein
VAESVLKFVISFEGIKIPGKIIFKIARKTSLSGSNTTIIDRSSATKEKPRSYNSIQTPSIYRPLEEHAMPPSSNDPGYSIMARETPHAQQLDNLQNPRFKL